MSNIFFLICDFRLFHYSAVKTVSSSPANMFEVGALTVQVYQGETSFDQAASYNNIPLNMVNGSEE